MLPLSWAEHARVLPGWIAVERHEEPYQYRGLIWVPETYRGARRPPFATVLEVGSEVDPAWNVSEGDIVAISPAAGIYLDFEGEGRERRRLYFIRPQWILAGVVEHDAEAIEDVGESRRRFFVETERERQAAEGLAEHGVTG